MGSQIEGFVSEQQRDLVRQLADLSVARRQIVATAESCTGGMIAAALTNLAGSSSWFDSGFITYSNEAKMQLLGVNSSTLQQHGAVSKAIVTEMANGAVARSNATVACAVSGVAGPTGGSVEKPVGTVWLAWAGSNYSKQRDFRFAGNRDEVRQQAVHEAIKGLIQCINSVAQ